MSGTRHTRRRAGRLLGVLGLLAACSVGASPTDPGDDEIAKEFLGVCKWLQRSGDVYIGEVYREKLESDLAKELAKPAPDPRRTAILRIKLANEYNELGRTDDALALLVPEHFSRFASAVHAPPEPVEEKSDEQKAAEEVMLPGSASASTASVDSDAEIYDAWLRVRLEVYLQAAEDQNCILNHTATSCILPFDEGAVHRHPDPARQAATIALGILERDPDDFVARWIVNLMRMASREYPQGVPEAYRLPERALQSSEKLPPWRNRALDLGLTKFDNAGGAIIDDFDGDGLLDLVNSTGDPCDSLKAYRNDGHGGFVEVTEAWGLSHQLGGLNVVHADYDGDGALDLLVLRGGWQYRFGEIRNSLLRNDLAGPSHRFVDVTHSAGLAGGAYPTQTAGFADYDLDGDLDLYIGNEAYGARSHPSQLFRNDDGVYTDVTDHAGVGNLLLAKGVAWGDYDDDGDPDLYVSNVGINRLYRNDGGGRFTDVADELGVTDPYRSFATWFFDYDNDGRLDLFVADYDSQTRDVMESYFGKKKGRGHPLIYKNTGNGFREISGGLGLTRPVIPMGANYTDMDNDGWLDFYLGTGEPSYLALVPNVMYRNEQGVYFSDVTFATRVGHLQKGHGVAFGDVDNDGDQDLFHEIGGFFPGDRFSNALFENPGNDHSWVTLRLEGAGRNSRGVGARIEVRVRDGDRVRSFHRLAGSGGSFGGSSFQQEIGLGGASRIQEIRIRWPASDQVQVYRDVEVDRIYRAAQAGDQLEPLDYPPIELGRSVAAPRPHQHR